MSLPVREHSAVDVAGYLDLLRIRRDAAISVTSGTPTRKPVKSRVFWYDTFRTRTTWSERHIGEDIPGLLARLA